MGRSKSPKRQKAAELYVKSKGRLSAKEIAEKTAVSIEQIRKWKSLDKWDDLLYKPKQGGQIGNKNAAGSHGEGNQNALRHGAYARVDISKLSEEEKIAVEEATLGITENLLCMLKSLKAKEFDLERRIRELEQSKEDEMILDKQVTTEVYSEEETAKSQTTNIRVNRFQYIAKLEGQLDKVRGRIIKLLDTARAYEADKLKADLENRKNNSNSDEGIVFIE